MIEVLGYKISLLSDGINYIVYKKTNIDKKSNKEYPVVIGYYGTLHDALVGVLQLSTKDYISDHNDEVLSIKNVIIYIDKCKKELLGIDTL